MNDPFHIVPGIINISLFCFFLYISFQFLRFIKKGIILLDLLIEKYKNIIK